MQSHFHSLRQVLVLVLIDWVGGLHHDAGSAVMQGLGEGARESNQRVSSGVDYQGGHVIPVDSTLFLKGAYMAHVNTDVAAASATTSTEATSQLSSDIFNKGADMALVSDGAAANSAATSTEATSQLPSDSYVQARQSHLQTVLGPTRVQLEKLEAQRQALESNIQAKRGELRDLEEQHLTKGELREEDGKRAVNCLQRNPNRWMYLGELQAQVGGDSDLVKALTPHVLQGTVEQENKPGVRFRFAGKQVA